MKRFLKIFFFLLAILIVGFLYIASTTGFFRSIDNTYDGSIKNYQVPGAEDFAISREDGFMIISSDDRAARRDGLPVSGGLYYMNLKDSNPTPVLLKPDKEIELYPHGISMIRLDSHRE